MRAAIIQCHTLGGLNNRNLLSVSSGGQRPTGLFPAERCGGESVSCVSIVFWCFAGDHWGSLACGSTDLCLHVHRVVSLCAVSIFPF